MDCRPICEKSENSGPLSADHQTITVDNTHGDMYMRWGVVARGCPHDNKDCTTRNITGVSLDMSELGLVVFETPIRYSL